MVSLAQGPIVIRRRAAGQAPGAPTVLRSGELAINFSDNWLYIGIGDDGAGLATSVVRIAGYQKFVELTGSQTIGGVKNFSLSPRVPTPTNNEDAVNKGYLDAALANAGGGDMMRSVYDTNGSGVVDRAELADVVPWSGVTGRPTEFPPEGHDANKIVSGTIDPARLPAAIFAAPVVSSGAIADLTSAQQDTILGGSQVVTSDGRLWTYKGSGNKTDSANYLELADKTPEWSVIANRPVTLAGYGITDAQPADPTLTALAGVFTAADRLVFFNGVDSAATTAITAFARSLLDDADAASARITLGIGSLGVQEANNVNITGGSLSNVTISDAVVDGGTF